MIRQIRFDGLCIDDGQGSDNEAGEDASNYGIQKGMTGAKGSDGNESQEVSNRAESGRVVSLGSQKTTPTLRQNSLGENPRAGISPPTTLSENNEALECTPTPRPEATVEAAFKIPLTYANQTGWPN